MVYPSAPTFRSFAQCASLHTAKVIRRSFRGAGRVASAPPPDQARAARAFASSSRASLDGRSAPVTCRSARFARRPQVHPSGNATVRTYATFGSAGSAGPPRAPNGKATPPSHGTAMSRSRVAISARAATCDPCRYSPSGQSAAPSSAGSGRQSKYSEALYGAGRAKHESPAPLVPMENHRGGPRNRRNPAARLAFGPVRGRYWDTAYSGFLGRPGSSVRMRSPSQSSSRIAPNPRPSRRLARRTASTMRAEARTRSPAGRERLPRTRSTISTESPAGASPRTPRLSGHSWGLGSGSRGYGAACFRGGGSVAKPKRPAPTHLRFGGGALRAAPKPAPRLYVELTSGENLSPLVRPDSPLVTLNSPLFRSLLAPVVVTRRADRAGRVGRQDEPSDLARAGVYLALADHH